ncbi:MULTISPECIES: hypothetical protein [unclassified Bradyrhizobium]|uniref:hypothetical protein n=1 Tax=unclassified Bradyrhizobium TaxID=2631580 RepID=UPI002478D027|nr:MULTISPECIES: hypothetical protein [unclassified Bradyrhizobium]WGR74043.1 hypothetical protein MTX24_14985 [Bradyrhizobium sp. ISRA426]WGR78878.1 hypothetical protein MTX21_00100 [Bradyrhizobium sp. ISRA430]WGR89282.1 hypothetical protein MTX25_15000 [Bradyrhizobium sp. ISRA432]
MKLYECADCHSTLNLVTRVTKAAVVRQQLKTTLPSKSCSNETWPNKTWLNMTTAKLAAQSGQPRRAK